MKADAGAERPAAIIELRSWLGHRAETWTRLLRELVEIESHSSQTTGVERVGQAMTDHLAAVGFAIERKRQAEVDPAMRWLADILGGGVDYALLADTVVARRDGVGGDGVVVLGDLDTSFAPGSLEEFPFSTSGGRAYGPGIADMKGGLVVLVAALHALAALSLPTPRLSIVLAGDEQAGSLGSAAVIRAEARTCRWCLCLECARDGGKLMAARAHIGVALVEAKGRASHAGSAHAAGVNAIHALAEVIPRLTSLTNRAEGILVTPTLIRGGHRRSVVPDYAAAVLDIRTPDQGIWNDVVARLRTAAAEATRREAAELEIRVAAHRPGVARTPATDDLLALVTSVAAELGINLAATSSAAAGSSAFAAEAGAVVLDGMGPSGQDLMTTRESIDLDSLVDRAAVLAGSLHRLSRGADQRSAAPTSASSAPTSGTRGSND